MRELEERIRELEKQVALLTREQEGDMAKFAELIIIKDKFNEANMYLKTFITIGKWIVSIMSAVIAGAMYIKRSAIWEALR